METNHKNFVHHERYLRKEIPKEEALAQDVAKYLKYWIHINIDGPGGNNAFPTPPHRNRIHQADPDYKGEYHTHAPTEYELKSWVDGLEKYGAADDLMDLYRGELQQYEKVLYEDNKYLLEKHEALRPEGPTATSFNTQAGRYKCERINPSTGELCQTSFSRSHDLTRHNDTIHNACKQEIRCDFCTDKTFSRADALIRHYRAFHPDLKSLKRDGMRN